MPRAGILAASERLFAETDAPGRITMETVAAAAGVGKGTLFRAFASREGLLDALWDAKLSALRAAIESGDPPLGPLTPSRDRLFALLDALLMFKLENRHLIRAREASAGLLSSEHYRWAHGLLRTLVEDAVAHPMTEHASYAAHVLLAALNIDLIDSLLEAGSSPDEIRRAQEAHVSALLDKA